MLLSDKKHLAAYLEELVVHHVSGQLKVAPEHTETQILKLMGKPGAGSLLQFKELFDGASVKAGKKQFLTYYLIAAYPGCTVNDMKKLKQFTGARLHIQPEQVQVFLPAPSTYAALMYYTERDPFTGSPIFVEKKLTGKENQKSLLVSVS